MLELRVETLDGCPDQPVMTVLVDGAAPWEGVVPGWQGFHPAEMLGDDSPLLPDDLGRRVAIYRCTCGQAGCGVVAPVVIPSPDGRRVSWVDARDFTGVFDSPLATTTPTTEGRCWDVPDLHFDRAQYLAEIRRATGRADPFVETPIRGPVGP
ncbi:hypothetical protein [Cellulomonas oligotrophica]|uniref:Uncharacterized protein n=1 Tax=Cellulomonas oligotrophica TaxID=931536 RepID=A0A7Y9FFD6_9CELL|nr:hypothetical protein [Cellulomonas oligotrophica]NYD86219.1 hypothetical protein [Cellulomonas oligotrophica]GIG34454.1 hypothetical protein Col01nite_36130 [Cellulomonas oligotrophica]